MSFAREIGISNAAARNAEKSLNLKFPHEAIRSWPKDGRHGASILQREPRLHKMLPTQD